MTSDVLNQIGDRTRARLREAKERVPLEELEAGAAAFRRPRNFRSLFLQEGWHVIAEVKLASPSEGAIAAEGTDPVAVAADYLANGARALSVLTEPEFFRGRPEYLASVRARHPDAPLLMKDFIVDEYQLYQALSLGADAALLIVGLLGAKASRELLFKTLELGLTPLVEVHDEEEMRVAADIGAGLVGVNNRNLKTLEVSLETSERLAKLAPKGAVLVAESGLRSGADLKRLRAFGYRGFLIGTHFMKTGQPGRTLKSLLKEAAG